MRLRSMRRVCPGIVVTLNSFPKKQAVAAFAFSTQTCCPKMAMKSQPVSPINKVLMRMCPTNFLWKRDFVKSFYWKNALRHPTQISWRVMTVLSAVFLQMPEPKKFLCAWLPSFLNRIIIERVVFMLRLYCQNRIGFRPLFEG